MTYSTQFFQTLNEHIKAVRFIRQHKLWDGFWNYGWVSKLLIVFAFLISIVFVLILFDSLNAPELEESSNVFSSVGFMADTFASESYDFLFAGGLKYVMLFFMEVIVFHMCRRTMEIIDGKSRDLTFKTFVLAQVRMLKVAIVCFFFELVGTILLSIIFGILGFVDFLEPLFVFLVQAYFLGFLVFDNYTEQFGFSIKASRMEAKKYRGVVLAVGLVLNMFFLIPVLGVFAASVITAVAVTLYMYRISDIHLREVIVTAESPEHKTQAEA